MAAARSATDDLMASPALSRQAAEIGLGSTHRVSGMVDLAMVRGAVGDLSDAQAVLFSCRSTYYGGRRGYRSGFCRMMTLAPTGTRS